MNRPILNLSYWSSVIVMAVLTLLAYDPAIGIHFFAGGSIESTMTLCPPSFFISSLCLGFFILFRFIAPWEHIRIMLLLLSVILWFLSGRTLGVCFDGRVKTGWFYISAGEIDLYYSGKYHNDILQDRTSVRLRLQSFIQIKNKKVDKTLYVSPIIADKAITTLETVLK